MLSREFLEDSGLYQKHSLDLEAVRRFEWRDYRGPALHRPCKTCGEQTTWNQIDSLKHLAGDNPQLFGMYRTLQENGQRLRNPDADKPTRLETTEAAIYRCEGCKQSEIQFVLLFTVMLDSFASYPPAISCCVQKTGQWPPPLAESPREMKRWLAEYESIYQKGQMCERFGYGLGSLAYYRRIVEDLIDKLLDDIAELFESDADKVKYLEKVAKARLSKVHSQKIDLIKDAVPPSLSRYTANPMGLLHTALSIGIHSLTEEDCLEIASFIRRFLVQIVRDVGNARELDHSLAQDIAKLKSKLDRIFRDKSSTARSSDQADTGELTSPSE
jgi:hypothetical protein